MRSFIDLKSPFKPRKGSIGFEDVTSEFLDCSCGNTVMHSGFDFYSSPCGVTHYKCNKCHAYACVDESTRRVTNITKRYGCGRAAS